MSNELSEDEFDKIVDPPFKDRLIASAAVQSLADCFSPPAAPPVSVQPTAKTSKLAYALAVLTDHPDWTNERIAEAVRCNVKYLSQSPKFKAARAAIQGLGQEGQTRDRRSRGADIDAYTDED